MATLKPIKLLLLSVCSSLIAFPAIAQEQSEEDIQVDQQTEIIPPPTIEEVMVVAKLRDTLGDIVSERIDQEAVADFLDAELMSRIGDSTVSAALVRVPGLTVVNDKFVYVRGLGERYSSAQLNGAQVPSPDLTRNVIPLDIFPTGILDSVSVQKGYSADMPAAFGGGNIDIRTKGIPRDFVFDVEIGTGTNQENGYFGLTYPGGDDDNFGTDDGTRAIPSELQTAIQTYRGDLSVPSILDILNNSNPDATVADATAINRTLATALNRNVDISNGGDTDPDFGGKVTLGNKWYLSDDLEFGALAVGSYDNDWKNRIRVNRGLQFNEDVLPDFSKALRTVNEVGLTGALNLGFSYLDEHKIDTTSLYLRNTEDEATIQTQNNNNFQLADGQRLRNFDIRFEERELTTNQIRGEHTFGDETMGILDDRFNGFSRIKSLLSDSTYSWYYSDSRANTDIPNEVGITAIDTIENGITTTSVRSSGSAGDFRFTTLQDEVESYGWDFAKPFYNDEKGTEITWSAGWDYSKKARDYNQTQFNIGTLNASADVLTGDVSDVFSDANIIATDSGFGFSVGGIGTESYLAAQTIEGAYGKFDWLFTPEWRLIAGVRWEQFQQASLPINPLEFDVTVGQVVLPPGTELSDLVFSEDAYYPAVNVVYGLKDVMGADDFNLRFGLSETVTRPDLREISPSTYIDPLTEYNVRGNPDLETSASRNYDVRAEWFFPGGNNFSISGFYKDISDPIEQIEEDGSEDNIFLNFANAVDAQLYGVELEGFRSLDILGERFGWSWAENFFVSGNMTWSDSEVDLGEFKDILNLENQKRPMQGHSEFVSNIQLGFDSPNGEHNATLAFNTFSERLFFAGLANKDDSYEQPFNSLNFSYSYYPSDRITLDVKVKNLLDEQLEIDQGFFRGRVTDPVSGVLTDPGQRFETTILEQTIGTSFSVGFKYSFGD